MSHWYVFGARLGREFLSGVQALGVNWPQAPPVYHPSLKSRRSKLVHPVSLQTAPTFAVTVSTPLVRIPVKMATVKAGNAFLSRKWPLCKDTTNVQTREFDKIRTPHPGDRNISHYLSFQTPVLPLAP